MRLHYTSMPKLLRRSNETTWIITSHRKQWIALIMPALISAKPRMLHVLRGFYRYKVSLQCRPEIRVVSITANAIVCSTAYLGHQQRNHQSSVLLTFCYGESTGDRYSPNKGPVIGKAASWHDFLMGCSVQSPLCTDVGHRHIVAAIW